MEKVTIHKSADVSEKAIIGNGSKIWNNVQVRENAVLGENCIVGKGAYIDVNVKLGNNVKIGNNVSLFDGLEIEDGVQIAPHVCFTNDKLPRAINPDGSLKGADDWMISKTLVKYGASIGAHSVIVCGVTIGKFALVGAGSVVTKNVPDHGLVYGNPARLIGYVCECGRRLVNNYCSNCDKKFEF